VATLVEIVYEDAGLLVVNKPAGLVCHPTKGDAYSSLISRARLHVGSSAGCWLVHRLDRETSGVVIIAKSNEAARELGKIWENGGVEKKYLALVHGWVEPETGTIEAPLGKDHDSAVVIKDCVRPDGISARTDFEVICRFSRTVSPSSVPLPFSVLRVLPKTGRKHQIRIHLAHLGHPIIGDKLYGGDEDCYLALVENRLTLDQQQRLIFTNHALHAHLVEFAWRGREWAFASVPPTPFADWFQGQIG
jgi:23S rRNA pseudouridine1911/1915/1917 synthase